MSTVLHCDPFFRTPGSRNPLACRRRLAHITATPGEVTEVELRINISIQCLTSRLHAAGAVAIFNPIRDAATRADLALAGGAVAAQRQRPRRQLRR
jgi:hypothetical protein